MALKDLWERLRTVPPPKDPPLIDSLGEMANKLEELYWMLPPGPLAHACTEFQELILDAYHAEASMKLQAP